MKMKSVRNGLRRGYSNAAVVPSVRPCVDLVNTIETTPLHVSLSNLADMLTMTRGWTLLILEVRGQRSRSQWTYMETSKFRKLWSPARQQIWPWSRSKVTVKVTTWYLRKGLVTRNTHAKYQSSICNSTKVMAKVKVFVTDGRTDRRTDRGTEGRMRFNVPTLSRKRETISFWTW